ncbi:polysaccharide polymerase [Bifidobacterium ramosum]|uniref:Polysaccharide polymerase n=1 Tax=Bifidobacterium ramosum TaxID=1798158 RepID=A0A6L4WYB0_9BIFI|nr:hypothetical protein [Bifidobacterium ramosum]KAB8287249.1 polysaccharide polymerase [Bifidobacterium ramosum]NEG71960.1 hypothetical protein [Bifidobacterium ramosum]
MNLLDVKIRPSFFYYLCFTLYAISNALTLTNFRNIENLYIYPVYLYVRVFCAIVLFIIIFSDSQIRLKLFFLWPLFILLGLSTYYSGSWNFLLLVLFAVASNDVDIKRLARFVVVIYSLILAVTSISSKIGLIPSYPIVGDGGLVRDPMGFTHPNTFSAFVVVVCCAFAILRFRKFEIVDALVYLFGFSLCWIIAYSRTSSICIIFICFVSFLFSIGKTERFFKNIYSSISVIFLAECVASLYLMVYFNSGSQWMNMLNRALSGRLDLANYFYTNFGVLPFGLDYSKIVIDYNGYTSFVVDNAFCHLMLESGYIVAVFFYAMYFYTLLRTKERSIYTYGMLLYVPVAFCETSAFLVCFNFSLIAMFRLSKGSLKNVSERSFV